MLGDEFLTRVNVLYVEDEDLIREKTTSYFQKLLNNVYSASNGQEGYEKFIDLKKQNIRVDAIISDITMPKMNGIEFFKKIREIDEDIPLFFTTGHIEDEFLFYAIKYNVYSYFTKPVNYEKLFKKLKTACHKYHQDDIIKKQNQELQRYLDAIDNVAIVSKADTQGKITFVNDIFCETSKYTKDELLGKPHNIIRHPDSSKKLFQDMWSKIKAGKTWKGKVKNLAKDGTSYFVNATIIPIFDDEFTDEIVEFIGIRFLTTEDEIERREFRKKVVKNLQEQKRKEIDYIAKIDKLQADLSFYNQSSYKNLINMNREKEEKISKLQSQIRHFESEIKELRVKSEQITKVANRKVNDVTSTLDSHKMNALRFQTEANEAVKELKVKEEEIIDLEKRLEQKNKKIEELYDVIYMKEKELSSKNLTTA